MQALIRYENVPEKIWEVAKMTIFLEIGEATEWTLDKLGIYSTKDLARANPQLIKR